MVFVIEFKDFYVDLTTPSCPRDALIYHDGPRIRRLCGYNPVSQLVSRSSAVSLVFISDSSEQYYGFRLFYYVSKRILNPGNYFNHIYIDMPQLVLIYVGPLTHWGRVTHICVSKLTINDSNNALSPGRRQAIIWANAGILLIGPSGTTVSEMFIEIYAFSFKKMPLKMLSGNGGHLFSTSIC